MKLKHYLLFTFLYIVIAAIGMAIMYHGFGVVYESPEMIPYVLWSELALSILILFYIRRYASWREVGYGELKWRRVLWMAPVLIVALVSLGFSLSTVASGNPSSGEILAVSLVALVTLLVGFAEETMFRGILLRGAQARFNVVIAMLISAVGFSLLHSVNVLGGKSLSAVPSQMASTLLDGLFAAPMAVLVGNLTPLIFVHFIWDFVNLASAQVSGVTGMSVLAGLMPAIQIGIQVVMMVIGWVVIYRRWRKGEYRTELA